MNTLATPQRRCSVLALVLGGILGGGVATAAEATSRELETLFESRVRPLLVAKCQGCHGDKVAIGGQAAMWKSVFLAAGIFACVAGAELLLIDSAVVLPMDGRGDPAVFAAPDWAPWSLISAGAVTILHFCALPTGSAKAAVGSLTPEPRFR